MKAWKNLVLVFAFASIPALAGDNPLEGAVEAYRAYKDSLDGSMKRLAELHSEQVAADKTHWNDEAPPLAEGRPWKKAAAFDTARVNEVLRIDRVREKANAQAIARLPRISDGERFESTSKMGLSMAASFSLRATEEQNASYAKAIAAADSAYGGRFTSSVIAARIAALKTEAAKIEERVADLDKRREDLQRTLDAEAQIRARDEIAKRAREQAEADAGPAEAQ